VKRTSDSTPKPTTASAKAAAKAVKLGQTSYLYAVV
jgi:hypothetical protein